ncbi:sigma-E factor negative regulatory protein [Xanthomonas campestris pv. asclepiadis]|uniref:sigma-E factor negative regulatory protein n=1 Tax=Xanthomonas campestris TaxID=339 RepID=UPI001E554B1F|nr:sigma-E factor negative regulatory protein [Xanthomonas campestris]MCC4616862.1 sigma-E factor negative regulatory protein [Xanthomonas campestris pv. asclepiadis]
MSHNPAMSTTDKFERHYRQQLSALVDGELSADESRFLLRRLAHDEDLAGCHERWQLCGDVLRGAASAPAPLDFAARVRSAIADEPVPQAQPSTRASARWRWGGGAAIAASVAAIALFMARERLPETAPPAPQVPVFATAAQLPAAAQAPTTPVAPKEPAEPGPAAPDEVATLAAAVPAAALASTRRGAATRNQQAARSVAARQQQAPARVLASAAPAATTATAGAAPSNPFTHPDTTLQARPWPRAALSGAGDSPLNASFRQGGQGTAFYPFEPAPQGVASPAPNRPLPVQPPQD